MDPTAVRSTTMAAVDKGSGGRFSIDDARLELVSLSEAEHGLLLLGSAGLYRGSAPLELAKAACQHPRDTAAAATAAAALARDHLVHKTTDDATWVKNEKRHGFEVVCIAIEFVWNEPLLAKPQTPVPKAKAVPAPAQATDVATLDENIPEHLRPTIDRVPKRELPVEISAEEAAQRAATVAFHTEKIKASKRAKLLERRGGDEPIAAGPATKDGLGAEKAPLEGNEFKFEDLDGTAQWRVRMAGAGHMRTGGDDPTSFGKDKVGGKGKGKSKGGKSKGNSKGKGKGKGKKKKGKDGGDGDGGSSEEGDYAVGEDLNIEYCDEEECEGPQA